jgi:protoheme IX farnesyltransferase
VLLRNFAAPFDKVQAGVLYPSLMIKLKAYFQLLKFRLSITVAFSSAIGYLLGVHELDWSRALLVMLGGLAVTGSANTINQIHERDLDKLMKRTAKRPLPTGVLSVPEAWVFAILLGVVGLGLLAYYFNPLTAALSLLSLILYGFIYTPLKTISPICVFVGAIPGGMPPLIGWVAATGVLGVEAWVLFGIQFMWQFPHFWAIAWVLDEDYKQAGFKMLPTPGGKDLRTAFQIMTYTLLLIPLSLLPLQFGMAGKVSAMIAVVCGVLFLMQTFYLMRTCSKKAAMNIMFGSFLYLPIVQIALVFDKL